MAAGHADVYAIQQRAGHKNIANTMHYTHVGSASFRILPRRPDDRLRIEVASRYFVTFLSNRPTERNHLEPLEMRHAFVTFQAARMICATRSREPSALTQPASGCDNKHHHRITQPCLGLLAAPLERSPVFHFLRQKLPVERFLCFGWISVAFYTFARVQH